MPDDNDISHLDAILHLENDPLDMSALGRITGLSQKTIRECIKFLQDEYKRPVHGLELLKQGNGYRFVPKKNLWKRLRGRYAKGNGKSLSRAAIETLAIIAYSQPVTKMEIENLRGVSADRMIRLLMDQELVRRAGQRDTPGRPHQYGTTKSFLRRFSLSSISDLPKLDDIEDQRFRIYER